MKSAFFSVVLAVVVQIAFAQDGSSVVCLPNGDVALVNVSPGRAAPCKFIELNTNAEYSVLCQVYYRDNTNPKPTTAEEVELNDGLMNLLLTRYLVDACQRLSADDLVDAYRDGVVFEGLVEDFPDWAQKMIEALYRGGSKPTPDLTITAVTMEAVGEFGELVLE